MKTFTKIIIHTIIPNFDLYRVNQTRPESYRFHDNLLMWPSCPSPKPSPLSHNIQKSAPSQLTNYNSLCRVQWFFDRILKGGLSAPCNELFTVKTDFVKDQIVGFFHGFGFNSKDENKKRVIMQLKPVLEWNSLTLESGGK